ERAHTQLRPKLRERGRLLGLRVQQFTGLLDQLAMLIRLLTARVATLAGPKARRFGILILLKEQHLIAARSARWTRRATVNASRANCVKENAIGVGITRLDSLPKAFLVHRDLLP